MELEKPKRGEQEPSPLPAGPRKSKRAPRKRSGCTCLVYLLLGCLAMCCLCCILPFCATVGLGGGIIAAFDHNKVTLTESHTFTVPADQVITIDVSNNMGDITLEHGSQEDEVVIQAVKTGYGLTKGAAQDRLDHVTVNTTQPDDTTVKIEIQNDQKDSGIKLGTSSVKLTISVPEKVNLIVNTGTGSIRISGLKVQSLDLESTLGLIEFRGALPTDPAALLDVRTMTGEIRMHLPRVVRVQIDAETSVGDVTVSPTFAKVDQTSGTTNPDSAGHTWIGTLGEGSGTYPTLKLRTKLGEIVVDVD